jgi:protein TonB
MKTKLITLTSFLILMAVAGYAQHTGNNSSSPTLVAEAGTTAQEMPKYPGGDQALLSYVSKQVKYPEMAREEKIQGKVTVRFMVDTDGKVKNASVPKGMGIGGGCDEEAVRVVMSLPAWQPAMKDGKPTSVWYTVPILFVLNDKK